MSNPQTYTVGYICALSTEAIAARAFLDEIHGAPAEVSQHDNNWYTLGKIGRHNIVIAVLPRGKYGHVNAATVARDMLNTFPNIRVGLMVGIGGGAPTPQQDVRLGDVVVSSPGNGNTGVIQYDYGKAIQDQPFLETGTLTAPPPLLLAAIAGQEITYKSDGHRLEKDIEEALQKNDRLRDEFSRPPAVSDRLYKSDFIHHDSKADCSNACGDEPSTLVSRHERGQKRSEDNLKVHYGLIATANTLMKDALFRDNMAVGRGVLCFEMEAAGLMDHFPCLVIRGICDYSDSHKNKDWQGYAAMAAAAYAKDLLLRILPNKVALEERIVEVLSHVQNKLDEVQQASRHIEENSERAFHQQEDHHREKMALTLTKEQQECHQTFKTSTYEQHKNINPDRVDGTCRWIFENPHYLAWQDSGHGDLLWISVDPGCGKSVLAKSPIDRDLKACSSASVCYFFFKDNDEQNNLATALCAVLHQLFCLQPWLLRHAVTPWQRNGVKIQQEVEELWRILMASISDPAFTSTVCIFDALDECRPGDRAHLIRRLEAFYMQGRLPAQQNWLKFLVTSRPYYDIQEGFRQATQSFPLIHVRGEEENAQIHKEISLVVKMQVAELGKSLELASETQERLEQQLMRMEHRTYLWLYLAMDDIRSQFQNSLQPEEESIQLIPSSVTAAYTKLLHQVPLDKVSDVKMVLRIIIGARRPLTINEMAMALGHAKSSGPRSSSKYGLNPEGLDTKIRRLCGLFVFISNSRVYLIHQTAREFLLSNGQAWFLDQSATETLLSDVCINYLLLEDINGDESQSDSDVPCFLEYSAEHWPDHVREMPLDAEQRAATRIDQLYEVTSARFAVWYPIFCKAVPMMDQPGFIDLAAFNGHRNTLQRWIRNNERIIDESDGIGANALYLASNRGHFETVQLLLDYGVNVDARCRGHDTSALQAASGSGHLEIARLLLEKGANVNAQGGGNYGNALQAASTCGHHEIARLLLEKGANVDALGKYYNNALQAASTYGHLEIARLLLEKGANVNAPGHGAYGNALQAASTYGHLEIARLLLEKGANVNAPGHGAYGNALQAASTYGHLEIARLLLEKGANVNAPGHGVYGNALQAASTCGHLEIARLLLEKGANVNAPGHGAYGNALQAASASGHLEIVQLLLDEGANVNAPGHRVYGNALQAASASGHLEIVQLLLDEGADVNAQGGDCGNALQAASAGGHLEIARLIISKQSQICESETTLDEAFLHELHNY